MWLIPLESLKDLIKSVTFQMVELEFGKGSLDFGSRVGMQWGQFKAEVGMKSRGFGQN
jgi:hypothetical protein